MQVSANAVGKSILCGEHAVVYGRPAIAIPVDAVRATATALPSSRGSGLMIEANDLQQRWLLADKAPLPALLRLALAELERPEPDLHIQIRSTIPIAGGMGSGAAVATALLRVLARALELELTPEQTSRLVYESERGFHGTPSGIDNTVVAYERPIWFQRRQGQDPLVEPLNVGRPLTLVIGDSGVPSETKASVGDLLRRWQAEPTPYEARFTTIGTLVAEIREALESGDLVLLGRLLDANQEELQALGLSSPELDRLVRTAREAGALGAKLTGGGWGGSMIALAADEQAGRLLATALSEAGAKRTLVTGIG